MIVVQGWDKLDSAVTDIIDNKKTDINYIDLTLHFIRATLINLANQKASVDWLKIIWLAYSDLSRYRDRISKPTKSQSEVERFFSQLDTLQVQRNATLYLMYMLGFKGVDAVELSTQDEAYLAQLAKNSQMRRKKTQQTESTWQKAFQGWNTIRTSDPQKIAKAARLGIKLHRSS